MIVEIRQAISEADMAEVRNLFREYADSLSIDLSFQDFERELADLPGSYASPRGALLIAVAGEEVAGCVGLRPLDEHTCEMKRLYIRPPYRSLRAGAALGRAVIEAAKRLQYQTMRLDTLPSMVAAIRLYEQLGFRDIAPYRVNPVFGTRYMELNLVE